MYTDPTILKDREKVHPVDPESGYSPNGVQRAGQTPSRGTDAYTRVALCRGDSSVGRPRRSYEKFRCSKVNIGPCRYGSVANRFSLVTRPSGLRTGV